jgi:hypothetical protein
LSVFGVCKVEDSVKLGCDIFLVDGNGGFFDEFLWGVVLDGMTTQLIIKVLLV